jgi:rod shape determining protein RodA
MNSRRLTQFLQRMPWHIIWLLTAIVAIGVILQIDAADGHWAPYAWRHAARFGIGLGIIMVILMLSPRQIMHLSMAGYFVCLALLLVVEMLGHTAGGAQSWLKLGFINIQPSEIMRLAMIMVLAQFYHMVSLQEASKTINVIIAAAIVLLPVVIIILQPDLGTAMMLMITGVGVMFAAGVRWRWFIAAFGGALALLPIAWMFLLHDYQQRRILSFFNPESDPLGAGYHVLQSKIAIGSAGFFGKGFLGGTQAHLKFLPEKHTDFIFTLLTEDFGLFGALILMTLLVLLIISCVRVAMRTRNHFMAVTVMGVTWSIFAYTMVNLAMAMGLMPVVGVPLPFVSYGGSSLLTFMAGMGLVIHAHVYRDERLPGLG